MARQYTKKSAEEKQAEAAKYAEQLAEGVARIRSSEEYKKFLDCMSLFHGYSFRNTMMIFTQRPDASRVAGFSTWKKLGRSVRKGEHGIRIWAPMTKKRDDEDEAAAEMDAKAVTALRGFRLVSVFDIAQTEGESLPGDEVVGGGSVAATIEDAETVRQAVEKVAAFPVKRAAIGGGARGYCDSTAREIVVDENLTGGDFLRTLVHETAHSLLHGSQSKEPREVKELQAETVAYIVCRHFGLDISDVSFGYVAGWATGMKDEEYIAEITALQKTAANIIDAIDDAVKAA